MCLIHGYDAHIHAAQTHTKGLRGEALGSDIEQLYIAIGAVVERNLYLARVHARVHRNGGNAQLTEPVDLVLHQGDKWRHDNSYALAHKRGHLICQ